MINILHINNKTDFFTLKQGEEVLASSTCCWTKLNNKRQIYITDVVSNKQGNGSLLMEFIINHFSKLKNTPAKRGYDRSTLWLKVLPDNTRAIFLYKKYGFVESTFEYGYQWMYRTLI